MKIPVRIRVAFVGFLLVLLGQHHRAYFYAVRHWLRLVRQHEHPRRCSWCDRGTRYGNPALPTSHGICISCRSQFRILPLAA